MTRNKYTKKMSRRRRRLRYAFRKAAGLSVTIVVIVLLVLADRLGLFGQPAPDDFEIYHDKSFSVVTILDGDTLDVAMADQRTGRPHTRIRFWGVDTPELAKEDRPVQHYALQASEFTRRLCLDKPVRLELLPQRTRDKYDRLLAYVYLPDGRMLNRRLVAEGFAYADPRFEHPYQSEFRRLQRQTKDAHRGLWKNLEPTDLPYYYRDKLQLPEADSP